MESSRAEARRVTCKPNICLRIYSLSYLILKSPLIILNSSKGLSLW